MQYLKSYEQFNSQLPENQMIDEGIFSTDWTNKEEVTKKLEKKVAENIKKHYSPYIFNKEKNTFVPVKEGQYSELVGTKEEAKQKEKSAVLLNNKGGEKSKWLVKGSPEFEKALEAAMKLKTVDIYYRLDTKDFAPVKTGRFQAAN